MFGLRQKLLLGFGGLLALLLAVDTLGIFVSIRHRGELDSFLTENWRSVDYGQHMVDSLEQLNDLARENSPNTGNAGKYLTAFDQNLNLENHNITLPGEQAIADDLTLHWAGIDRNGRNDPAAFRPAFVALTKSDSSAAERSAALVVLSHQFLIVKADARGIIKLNFDNLTPLNESIKAGANHATHLMILLSVIGTALAVLLVVFMSRAILKPVQLLTRSAKEIEQGNMDLVVQVNSRDELHQLAEAFNSMAARLREFRRTNRAKLIRTQQTTQLAINSLPDGVAIISPEGKIEIANAAAEKLFGLRIDADVAHLNLGWLEKLVRKTSATLAPIEPRGYESAVQVAENGIERFFLPHATPILDEDRALIGITIVLADVTNLRRLDEMKSGMLAVVSHELKTPLTSIRMGVHLMLEERVGHLNASQTEILLTLREDSDRLQQIIDNLLDMGRMEAGPGIMELRAHHLQEIIHQTTDAMESSFRDRGVTLRIELSTDLPDVMVDPARIGHVFSNLLSNALKHTPPGGEVTISSIGVSPMADDHGPDTHTTISISDTGPGIPAEHLNRIFDRFYRVPGQSAATGAGLGLAIAKEIVDLHGGQLTVRSKVGHGATFTFTLATAKQTLGALCTT